MIAWTNEDFESLISTLGKELSDNNIKIEATLLQKLFVESQGFNCIKTYLEALPLVVYGDNCSSILRSRIQEIVDEDLRSKVPNNLFEIITRNQVKYPLIADYLGNVEFSISWDSGYISAPTIADQFCFSLCVDNQHQVIPLNSIVHKQDFYSLLEALLPIIREGMSVECSQRDDLYEKAIRLCRQFNYACGFSAFEDRSWSYSYSLPNWDISMHPDLENVISMKDWRHYRVKDAPAFQEDRLD